MDKKEYIERQEVYSEINKLPLTEDAAMEILWAIDDIPTADVRPERHGKWIKKRSIYAQTGKFFECSCCGRQIETLSGELNYCPNCGAKMDGKDNDSNE